MNADIRINDAEYLVEKYLNDVVKMALVYVCNMDDAEDIAQQVFITYLHKRPLFVDEARAKSWLFKVTANTAKNYIRSRKDAVNFDDLAGILSTDDVDYGHSDREQAVLQAVLRLKPAYKEVIHLYYYNDYDTHQIAKILGVPTATVRTRLTRARAILEKDLKGGEYFAKNLQECNE